MSPSGKNSSNQTNLTLLKPWLLINQPLLQFHFFFFKLQDLLLDLVGVRKSLPIFEIENICRQQHKCDSDTEICSGKGRSIFSFSHNVFKRLKFFSESLEVGIVCNELKDSNFLSFYKKYQFILQNKNNSHL